MDKTGKSTYLQINKLMNIVYLISCFQEFELKMNLLPS